MAPEYMTLIQSGMLIDRRRHCVFACECKSDHTKFIIVLFHSDEINRSRLIIFADDMTLEDFSIAPVFQENVLSLELMYSEYILNLASLLDDDSIMGYVCLHVKATLLMCLHTNISIL